MSAELTPADVELLTGGNFATLVTMNPDGSPQASIVWIDAVDGLVLVNTAEGRVKARNLHRDPHAAVLVSRDPYDWVSITGTVVGTVGPAEGLAHIDALSRRYDDKPWEPVEGQQRVVFRIRPDRIARYA